MNTQGDFIFYDHREEQERIRVLQQMLRSIARYTGDSSLNTAVDGSFDRGTENALRAFQRKYGLTESGVADYPTWEKLRAVYRDYLLLNTPPAGITPFFDPGMRVRTGEGGGLVWILQVILDDLRVLYDSYDEVPKSGVYDEATAAAVRAVQRANLLDVTGEVDVFTWNRLASEYNHIVRDGQP